MDAPYQLVDGGRDGLVKTERTDLRRQANARNGRLGNRSDQPDSGVGALSASHHHLVPQS